MKKRKFTTVLAGALCLGLLSSCTIKLDEIIESIINSIDINAILESIDLESMLAKLIENFSLEDLIGIDEDQAQKYIESFDPSSAYDEISTISLSSLLKETGEDNETISLSLDDTLSSLTLSYSYTKGETADTVSLSKESDDAYIIAENGEEKAYTGTEAQSYVRQFKEDTIDKYAYSEENYFFYLIDKGDNSYYTLSNYIRFQGSYTSSDETVTVYDSAFTLEGLFVAGAIYKYTDSTLTYEYTAGIDYNNTGTQLIDLIS